MATPDFVLALREKIGTAPLWLSGVTAVVLRVRDVSGDGLADEVLLVRRADNGAWTPVTGIIDPGEEPATAALREVEEEAAVRATPEKLVWVHVTEPAVYDNGDQTQYLDLVFRLRWDDGEPAPADGENSEARWFPLNGMPKLSPDMRQRIQIAAENRAETRFDFGWA